MRNLSGEGLTVVTFSFIPSLRSSVSVSPVLTLYELEQLVLSPVNFFLSYRLIGLFASGPVVVCLQRDALDL